MVQRIEFALYSASVAACPTILACAEDQTRL
jgi:hypothetical protein